MFFDCMKKAISFGVPVEKSNNKLRLRFQLKLLVWNSLGSIGTWDIKRTFFLWLIMILVLDVYIKGEKY